MSKQPYNLVYVFADQWRRTAMGCAGEEAVKTPYMDAFAQQGVRCTASTSTYPLCSPHRASLLTGKYPLSAGFFTNCKPGVSVHLKEDEVCMGDIFQKHGYQTAYIGKYHLDEPEVNFTPAPVSGARDWDAYTPPSPRRHGFDFWYSYGTYDVHLAPHYWHDSPEMLRPAKWSVEHETDIAIQWLEKLDPERPFAMVLSWNPPHTPYEQVPQEYLDLYPEALPQRKNVLSDQPLQIVPSGVSNYDLVQAQREYYAAISGLDAQFKRLNEALERLGLTENTIIVLSADHGDMMGSHGLMAKNIWYEESIGIPFLAKGPEISSGVCGSVFGSQDHLPTLLGLMNLPIPATVEGLDCSNDIRNADTDIHKSTFLCSCPGSAQAVEQCMMLNLDCRSFGWRGIRTSQFTYIIDAGYEPQHSPKVRRLLYDLNADPFQTSPFIFERPEEHFLAANFEKLIARWLRTQNDPFYEHIQNA